MIDNADSGVVSIDDDDDSTLEFDVVEGEWLVEKGELIPTEQFTYEDEDYKEKA